MTLVYYVFLICYGSQSASQTIPDLEMSTAIMQTSSLQSQLISKQQVIEISLHKTCFGETVSVLNEPLLNY